MGQVNVDGDCILLSGIEHDEPLRKLLGKLKHGDTVELEIAGAGPPSRSPTQYLSANSQVGQGPSRRRRVVIRGT